MKTIGLTDAPVTTIEQETLGMLDHVEALGEFIRDCETPITIAFQGDWGTGKTSMMNMVREGLAKNGKRIETRWFNTWQFAQFQMQDEITLLLLSSFLEELSEGEDEVKKLIGKMGKLFASTAGQIAKAAVDIGTGGVAGDLAKDAFDGFAAKDSANTLRRLREDIQKAVEKLLVKRRADRMVVFVDDLDRLVPERAVEILEIMKLFLDVPRCVFILAVDYHVVSKGLEQKFGVSMSDLKGKSFFDKIIQLPFNLPVAQYDIRRYMQTLFGGQFRFREEDTGLLVRLAESSIGANPRSLKRLFNALQLLTIVARRKNMLDADGIATTEERQRLLFAALCLQLAYEPVYQLLLKESGQLDTGYFEGLTDLERIREDPRFKIVEQALSGRGEISDALVRFTDFMRTFSEAAQLASDQDENADDNLSFDEIDLLVRFLSLSALTGMGIDPNQSPPAGTFRHKAALLAFLERELKPRYQATLAKMDAGFKAQFKEKYGGIGFEFKLGSLAFAYWVQWDDEQRNLRTSLWQVEGATNGMVRSWFQANAEAFPVLQFNHLRCLEYAIFESLPFGDESSPEAEQDRLRSYLSLAKRSLDTALPVLVPFYETKRPVVDRLVQFADKLANRLREEFPAHEGWAVDNGLRRLERYGRIEVDHSAWKKRFSIALEADAPFATNLYIGLRESQHKQPFDEDMKQEVFDACARLFPEGGNGGSNGSWVFWRWLDYPQAIKNPGPGWDFWKTDCHYLIETPEREVEAIEATVDAFVRFKTLLPQLDALAASLSQE